MRLVFSLTGCVPPKGHAALSFHYSLVKVPFPSPSPKKGNLTRLDDAHAACQAELRTGTCSELRGDEKLAAGDEGVAMLGAPSAEQRSQSHLALGPPRRARATADLPAEHQVPKASL